MSDQIYKAQALEIAKMAEHIRRIEDENAELRERLANAHDLTYAWRRVNRLSKENAKLRELLCELYEDQCDECDRWKYRDRMRELGIEVGA